MSRLRKLDQIAFAEPHLPRAQPNDLDPTLTQLLCTLAHDKVGRLRGAYKDAVDAQSDAIGGCRGRGVIEVEDGLGAGFQA